MNPQDDADLFRLVYRSRTAIQRAAEASPSTISDIVAASQRQNAEVGVTGTLLFTGVFFVQALEGSAAAVEATFDRICCDLRHISVEVMECGPILDRLFGESPMSYLVPSMDEAALVDRVEHDTELADAAAAAMKLMAALVQSKRNLDPLVPRSFVKFRSPAA